MIERSFIKELTKIIGRENILASLKDLIAYSYDATPRQEMPDVIVFPHSTSEVSAVIKAAHLYCHILEEPFIVLMTGIL